MIAKFYMRGGHVIKVKHVKDLEMNKDPETGAYSGYKIIYHKGRAPEFLSLAIPEIVAVEVEKNFVGR